MLSFNFFRRIVDVRREELKALLWSFFYFFSLLSSYYILRPLRDEMGIAGGVQHLQWVFTGTFIVMLLIVPVFGAITSRYRLRKILPFIYIFFITNILIFFFLFRSFGQPTVLAHAFMIWTSVFNLFVISVFWSFMADMFSNEQAHRLFGFIAAGGSAGALVGPGVAALLATFAGVVNLLPLSAGFLSITILCIHQLLRWRDTTERSRESEIKHQGEETRNSAFSPGIRTEEPIGGGWLGGIKLLLKSPYLLGICAFILLTATVQTFLYFTQAHIVESAFDDPGKRTTLFALMDLSVNIFTISLQVFITGRLLTEYGVPVVLALIPVYVLLSFVGLGIAPILPVLVVAQVGTRAGNYAITRPGREVLFTVLGREKKYKAKNFIDTVVYRAGDALSGWTFAGLTSIGIGLSGIALIAIPFSLGWMAVGYLLGRRQEEERPV